MCVFVCLVLLTCLCIIVTLCDILFLFVCRSAANCVSRVVVCVCIAMFCYICWCFCSETSLCVFLLCACCICVFVVHAFANFICVASFEFWCVVCVYCLAVVFGVVYVLFCVVC